MAKKKEFSTKGWKANKELQAAIDKDGPTGVADYIKTNPNFSEKDYIDLMAGLYPHAGVEFGYGYAVKKQLTNSKFNKPTINDKAIDFTYDVMNLKRDWNKKNPKNKVSLDDHTSHLRTMFHYSHISSKMLHKLVSDPKYMLEDKHSDQMVPPTQVLKNDKIKPEHLYKYLASHPSHIDDLVAHDKADSRLEDLIFDNPEHLKNVSNSNIEHYLHKHTVRKEGQEPRLDISGKRAKTIVEHAHDKLYDDSLFKTLNSMDPEDKKSFIDRKLGITGGQPAGLASWRTDNDQANQESEGWADWTNGEEYDPKFAQRIAKSPHLSDDQAEHIKRHGDFNVKYNLYHNKHVDPKHGVEMFKMWHDNDENKGYSSEQLQDAYKEKKDDVYTIDDIDQDLIDEDDLLDNVDESTRQSYEFSDWVSDNEDDLLKEVELDDDDEDRIREKLHEGHDWTGDNSSHDAVLHGLHQKLVDHMDNEGLDSIHIDEAEGHLGVPRKEWQGNTIGHSDGTIDKDSLEEYMKDNNPKEIDYANSDDHTIDEHPEYDERYTEIADAHKLKKLRNDPYHLYDDNYEDYNNSDKYQEAWQENMKEAKEEAAKEHYGELYATSHQDDRFIPEHLRAHIPNIEEIKKKRKKAIGEPTPMLDKHIPNRSYEHPYGEDQNSYELLKDYADANGGSIDIGRMHKLMPAQGDVWKKIFSNKGKLSSQEIQSKIESLPKTPYAISYGKWEKGKTQNLNNQDQIVFRLDHTDQSLKPLQEDPSVYNTFKKVQEVSKRSGHPTKENSIAWARVDATDPDHWMIDEVQSDFGKTVTQYLKENGDEEKSKHVQKISDYHKDWREALINSVIKEAKKAGASKVSTHSPESKSAHTGSENIHSVYKDSYQKVPRKMGFKPSPGQTLPITDQVKENVFNKISPGDKSAMIYQHHDAWKDHMGWADVYQQMADLDRFDTKDTLANKIDEKAKYHTNIAGKHKERALHYGSDTDSFKLPTTMAPHLRSEAIGEARKHVDKETTFTHQADKSLESAPKDYTKQDYHQGHTLNLKPNLIKNMLDIVEDLVKFEIIYKHAEDYSIKKRAKVSIDLIKDILGYEADLSKWEKRREVFNDLDKTEQTQIPKHNEKIRQVADQYAQPKGLTLNHNIPQTKVDPEHAKKIANAYHNAQHNPSNPGVQKAYGALLNETNDQFKHILGTGLKITKMKPGQGNPYKSSKDLFRDIKNNNHMWYFPTEQGYGSGKNVSNHPLLQPTEHIHEGKPMLANDVFRIVHDYFGHAKEGIGFGPNGEEHAWKHHMQCIALMLKRL